jgi:Leucine Rich repeat
MGIYHHTEFFQGKPVADYEKDAAIADPTGTVYRLSVDYDSDHTILDLLTQFAADPNANKVTGLIIGMWDFDHSSQAVVDCLIENQPKLPNLTALFLGDIIADENEVSWIQQSNLSLLLSTYSNLEHLQVRGNEGLQLGELKLDRLKTLIIETGGLNPDIVKEICQAQLPELEHLELWLGDPNYGGDTKVEDLAPILAGDLFPKLSYLGLRDSVIADQVAIAVSTAPVMQKIKVLDLSLGNLGDVGATALLASPFINQLEKLNLNYHYISPELMSKLEELSIEVDISDEQDPDEDEDCRYISVSE